MQLAISLFPILLLIWLMVKKNSMPSSQALPLVAVILYFIKLIYFGANPNDVHANVIAGLLTALTPILIVFGAIFLFRTMEHSGAMDVVRQWLNGLTSNRVAQLMIVGWAFPFLIEGASGFGTPAALAAPILVGLGFRTVPVAILCLVMNSIPVSFGAVGTPTWFGFNELGLANSELLEVGYKSAVVHTVAALFIPVIALSFVIPFGEIKRNIFFVYLSILSCVIPMLALSFFTIEFPSLIGGLIGLVISVLLAMYKVGLAKPEQEKSEADSSKTESVAPVSASALIKASFPLWGTVLILVVTRIQQLGLKGILNDPTPIVEAQLGALGHISVSPSLVVGLHDIFQTSVSWVHNFLYVPSIVPFLLISVISFFLFKMPMERMNRVVQESMIQMYAPVLALLGALVMVKLLMMDGENANTMIIGKHLADMVGTNWQFGAAFLGALGSFFSGSATIANLTFGGIQDSIATSLGLNRTTILALQSVGGAMGNMVCINNIVAVCSVLAIANREGQILTKTVWPMLVYGACAAVVGLFLS